MFNLKKIRSSITSEQVDAALIFSKDYDYSKYMDRGQTDISNMQRQNFEGKKFEFAVYNWFKSKGWDISEVDVNIYSANKKSYAQDLQSGNQKFQLKSQSPDNAERFGLSFIFQCGNIYGTTNNGDYDQHAFNPNSNDGVICGIMGDRESTIVLRTTIQALHQCNLFKDPRKKEYIGIKKAVYLNDVEKVAHGNI